MFFQYYDFVFDEEKLLLVVDGVLVVVICRMMFEELQVFFKDVGEIVEYMVEVVGSSSSWFIVEE